MPPEQRKLPQPSSILCLRCFTLTPPKAGWLGGWHQQMVPMSHLTDAGSLMCQLVADTSLLMINKPPSTSQNLRACGLVHAHKGQLLAIYGAKRHHLRSEGVKYVQEAHCQHLRRTGKSARLLTLTTDQDLRQLSANDFD